MNKEQLKEFLDKLGTSLKASEGKADNRMIVKATYSFDIPDDAQVSGVMALISLNDAEVGRVEFMGTPGEPKSLTTEVDITNSLILGEYNIVKFDTQVLNKPLGFELASEAEFSIRFKGKKVVKEDYKTKAEVRTISDSWAIFA